MLHKKKTNLSVTIPLSLEIFPVDSIIRNTVLVQVLGRHQAIIQTNDNMFMYTSPDGKVIKVLRRDE